MRRRIRQVLATLLLGEDRPMKVRGHDGDVVEVGMQDVREIMAACACSESEAMDRLAEWIVERLSDAKN